MSTRLPDPPPDSFRRRAFLLGTALGLLLGAASGARAELHFGVAWYATAPDEGIRATAARRYDVGVTGLSSGPDRLAVKELNPDFRWFVYLSATDNYVPPHRGGTPDHDTLVGMLLRAGLDPEDGYLHYWDDTILVIRGDTLSVPGWGGGRATDPASARVPVYYPDLTRRAVSFATPAVRGVHKRLAVRTRLDVPFPDTDLLADGIFLDNASGHLFNRGEILAGGRVREAPGHAGIESNEFRDWYLDGFLSFLASLKDTLETSAAWSRDHRRKELMINVANVWEDAYVERDVADVLFLEFQYNPVRNCGAEAVRQSYERDARAAGAGITSFYSATTTRSVAGKAGELGYGDILLGNLAWYLLSRSPATLFYQQGTNAPSTAGWDTLTWRGVMDVADEQLGEAVAPPYTLATGTDPVGNPYAIQARNYEGGLVVLRNRGGWKEGVEPATAVTVDLPGWLAPVSPEGRISSVVNRISLRNGEGAVLLGDPGPPPGD